MLGRILDVLYPVRVRRRRRVLCQSIERQGDFKASDMARQLWQSFCAAESGAYVVPEEVRAVCGMSGYKYRSVINHFVRNLPVERYLEVGSWKGSTAISALHGNSARGTCIDNWSGFGGPREEFVGNLAHVLGDADRVALLDADFRDVDFSQLGQFQAYLFDGPHDALSQCEGVELGFPAMADECLLVVDDWNWARVRAGTFAALDMLPVETVCSVAVRTTQNEETPTIRDEASEWHNGYFIAVLRKV